MKKHTLWMVAACWMLGLAPLQAQKPLYKQADAPIEDRVNVGVGTPSGTEAFVQAG